MTQTQQSLFELLVELDEICKKHGITYYLVGGSALGAVRHHGFLPWDDDADIVLTRDNWEKLKKAFETDLPPNRACVSWEDCPEEPSVFFRYVNTSQTCIHHSLWDHEMPWGMIVDIFVLNPLPADSKKWGSYHKAMRRFGEYVMNSFIVMNDVCSIHAYLWDCITGKRKGNDVVKQKLYHTISKYSEEECTHYSYLYPRLHIVYPKEIFQEPRYVPFEGRLMPVPTLAEEHFRILFGDDWYNIPKTNDLIVHYAAHDNIRSYREYMYDYLHYAKKERVRRYALIAKVLKMFRSKVQHIQDRQLAGLRRKYLEQLFEKQYRDRQEELEALWEKRDFFSLGAVFAPYCEEQLLPLMVNTCTWIPVPPAYFEYALQTLVHSGQNRKAEKIMGIYLASHKKAPQFWGVLAKLLDEKKQLFFAYEKGQRDLAGDMAARLVSAWPCDKDIRLLHLRLLLEGSDAADPEKLMEAVLEGERQWPEDWEFQSFHADLLARRGEKDAADQRYRLIAANTRNGMLLMALQEKGVEQKEVAPSDRYAASI